MVNAAVQIRDLSLRLGRVPQGEELVQAQHLLDECVSALELWLGRRFGPVEITDEVHVLRGSQAVEPYEWPVVAYTSVTVSGGVPITNPALLAAAVQTWWGDGVTVKVSYIAGDPAPPAVKAAVLTAVVAALSAPAQVASGVLQGYSVEGQSISYGSSTSSAGNADGVGRMVVADLRPLARLKHRTVRI